MDAKQLEIKVSELFKYDEYEAIIALYSEYPDIRTEKLCILYIYCFEALFRYEDALLFAEVCSAEYAENIFFRLKAAEFRFILSDDAASLSMALKIFESGGIKSARDYYLLASLLACHKRYNEMLVILESMDERQKIIPKWCALKAYALSSIGCKSEACEYYAKADAVGEGIKGKYFLLAHPKTGYTWLRYILIQILAYSKGQELPYKSLRLPAIYKKLGTDIFIRPTHDGSAIRSENGIETDPHYLFEYDSRNKYKGGNIIFITRDPRDVLVSLYHQMTKRSLRPLSLSLSEFIRHPVYGWDRVIRFHEIWARENIKPQSMFMLSYESLHKNTEEIITALGDYLNINISPETAREIAIHSNAKNMRDGEKNQSISDMRMFPGSKSEDALKVRKAKSGSYLEEMSKADQDWCSMRMQEFPEIFGALVAGNSSAYKVIENT